MNKKEMIQIARSAIDKNMDYETLYYSDYMYGNKKLTEDVYEYVIEAREQGTNWFNEEYSEYL
jgi:hypothetical protein